MDTFIIDTLRQKGYKATAQRIAVCRFALKSREHPSAQEIYGEVKKIHPTVSLATVYKTLQILKEENLIQELDLPESKARFDPNMNPHVNIVCLKCGKIQDFSDDIAREMVEKVVAATEFASTGQRIDIYGLCKTCGGKTK
ncbi:MAG: transcriptional repressor [Candidatus Bathyarchaeota archaeon]|nr:transcriptional repressor [Candidatus Bathyarchaeota archaeon]